MSSTDNVNDKPNKVKQMNIYRTKNTKYAQKDQDYYKYLHDVKPVCANIDELLEFYNAWFKIYEEVVANWDMVDEGQNGA